MKAATKEGRGPGQVQVRAVADPEPRAGEVVVAIRYAGLCHTDVSMLHWNDVAQRAYHPQFPLIMGHEYTGTVIAHGPGTDSPPLGARVAGSAHLTCGVCLACQRGKSMLCDRLKVLGLDVAGVYAEYAAIPARNLVEIPAEVPDTVAVLAEPYAVAAHAVETGEAAARERVAIVGPGAVGLCATAAARFLGVPEIAVFGLPEDRAQLSLARSLGAAVTAAGPDGHTGAFDLVVETAGHPSAVATALRLCQPGGTVVTVGLPALPLPLDTAELARQEKRLIGVRAYDLGEWQRVPAHLAATPALANMVTHTVGIGDLTRAAELITTRTATKVIVDPTAA